MLSDEDKLLCALFGEKAYRQKLGNSVDALIRLIHTEFENIEDEDKANSFGLNLSRQSK